jgi:16S rRNA (adenine1518-N6/adenine1519-N6)-dimethyltransferase
MYHRPKKSLGQNFLKNQGVIVKIRDAADPVANDIVLEIGPGLGALTEDLLKFVGKVIAVEKDDLLIMALEQKFKSEIEQGKLDIIHGDILEFDPEILRAYDDGKNAVYKLVANIPYYITGAIIEKFLSTTFQPRMMVLLVQKEVAERIVAKNKKTGGAGKESILSIAVKAYGMPYYISTVRAGSFVPAPSVDSAIIAIEDISREHFKNPHHEEVFFQVMKAGFAHKRKTLSGNLKQILEPELVESAMKQVGLAPTVRAEDVGIDAWRALAAVVYTVQYES